MRISSFNKRLENIRVNSVVAVKAVCPDSVVGIDIYQQKFFVRIARGVDLSGKASREP